MGKVLLIILAALFADPVHTAEVLSIEDGDTITVIEATGAIKVRLACIDAPETSQVSYGRSARQAIKHLLPNGSQGILRIKANDRYGRTVAEVFHNGNNINKLLVKSGDSFVYWQYINGCDRQDYARLETMARLQGSGVWSVPGGIQRPWDYRQSR